MYSCIFSGGSVRGLCYTGVLRAFEELNIKIDKYIGSSIGALMITFYAIGYSPKEIKEQLDNLDLWKLFTDFNFNIINDFAISKGEKYLNWLRIKIESKFYGDKYIEGKMPAVCFKDVDKDIIVAATNILDSKMQIFSRETTPDVEIAFALRASSAMPALMPAVKFQNKILIDGDISRGRPIWRYLSELFENNGRILEFRITGGPNNEFSKNPIKLINSIISAAGYVIDNEAVNTYKKDNRFDMVQIDVPNVSFLDFMLTKKDKQDIFNIGHRAVMKYFNKG